jgi:hypothetical protein
MNVRRDEKGTNYLQKNAPALGPTFPSGVVMAQRTGLSRASSINKPMFENDINPPP